jgi:hypothetical protein
MSEDQQDEPIRPSITISGHEYEVTEAGFLTLELAERICRRYGGGESLRSIAQDCEDIPSEMAVRKAYQRHDWFRAMWEEAGLIRADKLAEEMVEIADDTSRDMYLVEKGENAFMAPNMAAVARAKLQVETRKVAIRHLNPRKYAEKHLALEEGVGGLVISWGGGMSIGRVPRAAVSAGRKSASKAIPAVIEGEYVEVSDQETKD